MGSNSMLKFGIVSYRFTAAQHFEELKIKKETKYSEINRDALFFIFNVGLE